VKVISWNVNKRREPAQQMRVLAERRPDIIALQEVRARSVAGWVQAFKAEGFHHVRATGASEVGRGAHASGVLSASRHSLNEHACVSFPVPSWEEQVLSLLVDTPLGELTFHNVHVPNGSDNGWAKVEVLEAVYAGLAGLNWNRHTVLCGDFNTPQCELPSGQIVTWAQEIHDASGGVRLVRRIAGGSGLRWDTAERNILSGLQVFGLRDAFRSLHGYEAECLQLGDAAPGSNSAAAIRPHLRVRSAEDDQL
jgi:exonuclease III